MKKNIIKFIIIFSLIFSISDSKVFSQFSNKIISSEKLEKLLTENTILISENIYYFNYHSAEWKFNKEGTYSVNPPNDSETNPNPNFGTWKITGLSNNSLILTDYRKIKDKQFQFYFGEDGYIYRGAEKIYSYKSENIKEKIYRETEEKRIAEELRLKKIEEEKRQLAIKREQERIKAVQIKKEEERKRLELAEWAKKEEEERIKRENEERIKLEREEQFQNILKYSLILIGIIILTGVIYYLNKFHKNKVKNLFLNLKNYFKNKFFNKEFLNKNIKNFSNFKATFNKPSNLLNVKDFNISKSTLFKMTDHNTFEIKFKKKVLKEELFDFLKKNLPENRWKFFGGDRSKEMWFLKSNWNINNNSQIYVIKCLGFPFRYQYLQNFKYAEEFTNLVNKKFSSLEHLINEEVFEFKSLLSEKLLSNGNITLTNKVTIGIGTLIIGLILFSNTFSNMPGKPCACPCYYELDIPHTYYDPKTGNYIHTPKFYKFLEQHCK